MGLLVKHPSLLCLCKFLSHFKPETCVLRGLFLPLILGLLLGSLDLVLALGRDISQ
jgi:hypothetical protein